jgi:hypothetical protein
MEFRTPVLHDKDLAFYIFDQLAGRNKRRMHFNIFKIQIKGNRFPPNKPNQMPRKRKKDDSVLASSTSRYPSGHGIHPAMTALCSYSIIIWDMA